MIEEANNHNSWESVVGQALCSLYATVLYLYKNLHFRIIENETHRRKGLAWVKEWEIFFFLIQVELIYNVLISAVQ